MTLAIADSWRALVLRGIAAIILGAIAFMMPGITLGALVILFGAYTLVDGIIAVVGAWRASRAHDRWGALVLEGIAGIVAAAITMVWPAVTAFALVMLIGAWALVTGIFEIVAAVRLRRYISGEWLLALSGFASVMFGLFVMLFPLAGAVAIAFAIGIYSVIFGGLLIGLGLRLRTWSKALHTGGSSVPLPA
jgi:uncharacterized membrane protein HdeD (DUF308 family)